MRKASRKLETVKHAASRSCLRKREFLSVLEPRVLLEPDDDDHKNCDHNGEDARPDEHSIAVPSAFVGLPFKP